MTAGTPYYSILMLLCALASGVTEGAGQASWNNQACTPALCSLPARTWCKSNLSAGGSGLPAIEVKRKTRTLLQALAPAPSPSSVLTLQAGPGDVQVRYHVCVKTH